MSTFYSSPDAFDAMELPSSHLFFIFSAESWSCLTVWMAHESSRPRQTYFNQVYDKKLCQPPRNWFRFAFGSRVYGSKFPWNLCSDWQRRRMRRQNEGVWWKINNEAPCRREAEPLGRRSWIYISMAKARKVEIGCRKVPPPSQLMFPLSSNFVGFFGNKLWMMSEGETFSHLDLLHLFFHADRAERKPRMRRVEFLEFN